MPSHCFISYSTVDTLQFARRTATNAGMVKSVLRLFDELVKCDKEDVLKNVRDAVEAKDK